MVKKNFLQQITETCHISCPIMSRNFFIVNSSCHSNHHLLRHTTSYINEKKCNYVSHFLHQNPHSARLCDVKCYILLICTFLNFVSTLCIVYTLYRYRQSFLLVARPLFFITHKKPELTKNVPKCHEITFFYVISIT